MLASFLVIVIHAAFLYYDTIAEGRGFWVFLLDTIGRPSVPLFVMVSSYLLLPLKDSETPGMFYRRRFMRVLIPFIVWSLLYAVLPYLWGEFDGERVKAELTRLLYNFNYYAEHLWYMYMFVGIYLIMPVVSPWLKTVSKRFEQGFLVVWFLTTFYQYVKYFIPEIYGECTWNEFTPFWYVSGYIGYVVLAHYIRMHVDWSLRKSLAVGLPLILVGGAITFGWFDHATRITDDNFVWELGRRFCTFNVVMMTAGSFIVLKKFNTRSEWLTRALADVSKMSFGIYLSHMFIVKWVGRLLAPCFESVPLAVLTGSLITFVLSYLLTKALSYLPGGKYLVG